MVFKRAKQPFRRTVVTILVRSGLDTMTPNQVLGDVMTDDTYRDDDEKEEKKEKKDDKKDDKKEVFIQEQRRVKKVL